MSVFFHRRCTFNGSVSTKMGDEKIAIRSYLSI